MAVWVLVILGHSSTLGARRDSDIEYPVPECSCGCCTTSMSSDGYVCSRPVQPAAYAAQCEDVCRMPGNFMLDSRRGDDFQTERFCHVHCEPSPAAKDSVDGECIPLQESTIRRTYPNITHNPKELGYLNGSHGLPLNNDLGNGRTPVLDGPVQALGDVSREGELNFVCGLFDYNQVCNIGSAANGLDCSVRLRAENCHEECIAKGLICLDVFDEYAACSEGSGHPGSTDVVVETDPSSPEAVTDPAERQPATDRE